jgi:hypothetical protein
MISGRSNYREIIFELHVIMVNFKQKIVLATCRPIDGGASVAANFEPYAVLLQKRDKGHPLLLIDQHPEML